MVAKEKLTQETTYLFFNVVLHYDIPPPTYLAHSHLVPSKEGQNNYMRGVTCAFSGPGQIRMSSSHTTGAWSRDAGTNGGWAGIPAAEAGNVSRACMEGSHDRESLKTPHASRSRCHSLGRPRVTASVDLSAAIDWAK